MTISDLQMSPDERTVYVAAGMGEHHQVSAFDVKSKRELWHSHDYDVGMAAVSPNGSMLATGYVTGSLVHLIDLRTMKHVYAGPRFGTMVENSIQWNPKYAEALVISKNMVALLRKVPLQRLSPGPSWKGTGFYVRRGGSFYAFGKGKLSVSTLNSPESDRWSREETDNLFFGEADGRIDLGGNEKREGEVYLKAEPGSTWEIGPDLI